MSNHELPRPDADQPPAGGPGDPIAHRSLADRLDAARAYTEGGAPTEDLSAVPPTDDDDTVGIDTAGIDARMEAEADDPNAERRRSFRGVIGGAVTEMAYRSAERKARKALSHPRKRLVGELDESTPAGEREIRQRIAAGKGTLPKIPRTERRSKSSISRVDLFVDRVARRLEDRAPASGSRTKQTSMNHDAAFSFIRDKYPPGIKDYVRWREDQAIAPTLSPGEGPSLSHREAALAGILDAEEVQMQRRMFEAVTGLSLREEPDGKLSVHGEDAAWAREMNPHNIRGLIDVYSRRYTADAQDKGDYFQSQGGIPGAQLRSGSVRFLENGMMAAYFGVSAEAWMAQKRGGKEVVPPEVIEVVEHYLSISDGNLDSACEAIPPANQIAIDPRQGKYDGYETEAGEDYLADNERPRKELLEQLAKDENLDQTARDGLDPVARVRIAEIVPEQVWREALGYRSPRMTQERRAELMEAMPDFQYMAGEIKEAVRKEEAQRKRDAGVDILSLDEHHQIVQDKIEELVRISLGPAATRQDIARFVAGVRSVYR